jgi:hypothetical protein
MPVTFQGGQSMPAAGTAAYAAAQQGSGAGSYNTSTGSLSAGGQVIYSPSTTPPQPTQQPAQPKSALYPTVPVNTALNAAEIGKTNPLKYPTYTPGMSAADINAAVTSWSQALGNDGAKSPLENERSQLKNTLTNLMNQAAQKSSDFNQMTNAAGVPQMTAQLQDLNKTIAQKVNEFTQQYVNADNKAIPTNFIVGEQTQIQKQSAVVIGALSATAQALQGNIQLANDTIDRTLAVKYDSIEKQIQYNSALIDLNYQDLSEERKQQADLRKSLNEERLMNIQDTKSATKEVFNMVMESNATPAQKQKISTDLMSATTPFDVYQIGLKAGVTPISTLKTMQEIKEIQSKIAGGQTIVTPPNPFTPSVENNANTLQAIFKSQKVSAANKTTIGNGLALSKAAQDLAEANADGDFAGLYPGRGVVDFFPLEAFKRESTIKNESLISTLDLQTQYWASGAALSDEQTKLVQKMIPTKSDKDSAVRTKLNQLVNYMLSQTASRLSTDGIDFKPQKVDLFETTNLLGGASPEQLQALQAEGLIE